MGRTHRQHQHHLFDFQLQTRDPVWHHLPVYTVVEQFESTSDASGLLQIQFIFSFYESSASSLPLSIIDPTFEVPTLTSTLLPCFLSRCLLICLPPLLFLCLQPVVAQHPLFWTNLILDDPHSWFGKDFVPNTPSWPNMPPLSRLGTTTRMTKASILLVPGLLETYLFCLSGWNKTNHHVSHFHHHQVTW